jgi:hypothetical protein
MSALFLHRERNRRTMIKRFATGAFIVLVTRLSFGDGASTGTSGINSQTLTNSQGLNGQGIIIGQVEPSRPGDPAVDTDPTLLNQFVTVAKSFRADGPSIANVNVTTENGVPITPVELRDHATQVASVMISTDHSVTLGVSPGASLYSAGIDISMAQSADAITAENLVTNGARAINISFGANLVNQSGNPDGTSLFTEFVDWSAQSQNVLYCIANDEDTGGFPVPTDNYNGITVAATVKVNDVGDWVQLAPNSNFSSDATGPRTSVDLVAPGGNLIVAGLNNTRQLIPSNPSGTSFAAPHVTGTAALLRQYVERQITNSNWSTDGRQHAVMKAVLMNSTQVIADDGTGHMLGMDKTILDTNGKSFIQSDTYADQSIPLNKQMGTGQLDANRAFQQLSAGEFHYPTGAVLSVPAIGWDYNFTDGQSKLEDPMHSLGDTRKYRLGSTLTADQYVSITLCWDRQLFLDNDVNGTGRFDNQQDTFLDVSQVPDLNLYLMPAGATDLVQAIWKSVATDSTVEHIFRKVSLTGSYEIWVTQASGGDDDVEPYALAWWTREIPNGPSRGDYNNDGQVNASDYGVWQNSFGSTSNLAADGNGDGVVDAADYTLWRAHLGQMVGSGSAAAVPEPPSLLLCGIAVILGGIKISRWRNDKYPISKPAIGDPINRI